MTDTTPTADPDDIGYGADTSPKTRKTLNLRLLIGTLVALAVLGPAAYAWRTYQVTRTADAFLDRAKSLEEGEKWQDAATYLFRYLQLRSDSPDAWQEYVHLARTFDKSADSPNTKMRAIELYYRAIGKVPLALGDRDAQVLPLRCRLAELLLEVLQFDAAEKEADEALVLDSDNSVGKRTRALALYGQLESGALAGTGRDAVGVVGALEDSLQTEANRGDIRLSSSLAHLYRDPAELPDERLAVILACVHHSTEAIEPKDGISADPTPADPISREPAAVSAVAVDLATFDLAGMKARLQRADVPLPDELVEISARLAPQEAKASGSPLGELLTLMYSGKEQPVAKDERAVAAFARGVLADDVMDDMIGQNPKNAEAYLARYAHRMENSLAGANEDLEAALKFGPDSTDVLMAAAQDACGQAEEIRKNDDLDEESRKADLAVAYEKARGYYLRAIDVDASLEAAYTGLGRVLAAEDKAEPAIDAWEEGLAACGATSILLNTALAEFLINQGRVDEAEKPLDALFEQAQEVRPYLNRGQMLLLEQSNNLLRGRWYLQKGEYAAAVAPLRRVTAAEAGTTEKDEASTRTVSSAYLALADAYRGLGQQDQAALNYEKALEFQPELLAARALAASAWLATGRADLAIRHYERALAIDDDSESRSEYRLGLASAYFAQQRQLRKDQRNWRVFESALDEIKRPERIEGLDEAWRVPVLEAQYLTVKSREAVIDQESPDTDEQPGASAREVLVEAEKEYPDSINLFRTLPLLYDSLGFPQDADRAIEKLEKLGGEPDEICQLRGLLYRNRRQYDKARTILQHGIATLPKELAPPLRGQLVEIDLSEGKVEPARKGLEALMTDRVAVPRFMELLRQLAEVSLETNELDELDKCVAMLHDVEGDDGSYWRYYEARRLLGQPTSRENLEEVESLLRQIESKRPMWPTTNFLAGLLLEKQGKVAQAIQKYQDALRLGDRSFSVYQRLFLLVGQTSQYDEADRYFEDLVERGLSPSAAAPLESRLAAGRALQSPGVSPAERREQLQRAVDAARRSVQLDPDDALRHVWLGKLLFVSSRQPGGGETLEKEAEAEFREAVRLSPTDVRMYQELFTYYIRSGQIALAESTLKDVQANTGLRSFERGLTVGRMYEELGKTAEASEAYQQLIASCKAVAGSSPQAIAFQVAAMRRQASILLKSDADKAIAVYRGICDLVPESAPDRRLLAVALALRSAARDDEEGDRLWDEAEVLLKEAGSTKDSSITDVRLRAMLLFQKGGQENLKTAQELFERLVDRPDAASEVDRLALARIHDAKAALYRVDGNDARSAEELRAAREQYQALVTGKKPNGFHLISYVDFLLRNGLDADVAPLRKKLHNLANSDAQLLGSYVDLMLRHERPDEASPLLDELEKAAPDDFRTTELRVRWLDARGEVAKIEGRVEPAAAKLLEIEPKDTQQRARLCTRVGNLYSAVGLYDLAAAWYRRVVELVPEEYESLAVSLAKQGQTNEAIQICDQAAKTRDPKKAALAMTSVLAYGQPTAEDFELAEETFRRAAAQQEADPAVLLAVANAKFIEGKMNDAVELYRQVLKLQPKNVLVLNNLATLLMEQSDGHDEALRCIDQAIDLAGPRPALLDTKGSALIYAGKPDEAVNCLKEAVHGLDVDPRFHLHLAVGYCRLGDMDKARTAMKEVQNADLAAEVITDGDRKFLAELESKLGQ